MGALHEALRSYSLYVGYEHYQKLIVSLATAITILIFLATMAIGVLAIKKL